MSLKHKLLLGLFDFFELGLNFGQSLVQVGLQARSQQLVSIASLRFETLSQSLIRDEFRSSTAVVAHLKVGNLRGVIVREGVITRQTLVR